MENRTILETFLLTGFVVSSCGWVYIHYKYVFKPMREQNKILHDKLVKECESKNRGISRTYDNIPFKNGRQIELKATKEAERKLNEMYSKK